MSGSSSCDVKEKFNLIQRSLENKKKELVRTTEKGDEAFTFYLE